MKYSVVLPCYNEAEGLQRLVERFRQFQDRWDFELILVDNGSTDESAKRLAGLCLEPQNWFVRTVTVERNIGYGNGLLQGLRSAESDIVAYSHADLQTPPEDVFRAFDMIENGQVDIATSIVRGLREGREAVTFLTRWLRIVTATLTAISLEDINGQPKVFPRALLDKCDCPPVDFSFDTYILYVADREGFAFHTLPVRFDYREYGESSWATTLRRKLGTILEYIWSIVRFSWHDRQRRNNPLGQALLGILKGLGTNAANFATFLAFVQSGAVPLLASSAAGLAAAEALGYFLGTVPGPFRVGARPAESQTRHRLMIPAKLAVGMSAFCLAANVAGLHPVVAQVAATLACAASAWGVQWLTRSLFASRANGTRIKGTSVPQSSRASR